MTRNVNNFSYASFFFNHKIKTLWEKSLELSFICSLQKVQIGGLSLNVYIYTYHEIYEIMKQKNANRL